MEKFIKKIIVFALIPICYFAVNMVVNFYIFEHEKPLADNTEILIAGDSHPQTSLDPAIFSNASNIAQTAQPIVATYWVLQKVLQSAQPELLLIGFAPHNIAAYNDQKFSNPLWSHEMFKRYYPVQNFSSIDKKIPVDYPAFYKTLWKKNAFFPKLSHKSYIGYFRKSTKSKTNGWKKVINRHYHSDSSKSKLVSRLSIEYLDSLIRLCKRENIEPVLLSNPVHPNYKYRIPQEIMTIYDSVKNDCLKKGIIFIDLLEKEYPDSLYLNADHLNLYGAQRFSNEVLKALQKHIPGKN